MRILLDTHMVIWALTNDPHLSDPARKMIASPDNQVCFSTVSLWEIAIKNQMRPDKCPYHEKTVMEYCIESGFEPVNILPSHVLAIRELRIRPNRELCNLDPFDRLLVAQARVENCLFLTHDRNLENYQESCICLC